MSLINSIGYHVSSLLSMCLVPNLTLFSVKSGLTIMGTGFKVERSDKSELYRHAPLIPRCLDERGLTVLCK